MGSYLVFYLFYFNFFKGSSILLLLFKIDKNVSYLFILQMDLREKETAAAVQDLEVRQMELEAQRRRLEQVAPTFPPCSFFSVTNRQEQTCESC